MRNGKIRALAALGLAAIMGMGYLAWTANSAHAQEAQTAGAKSGDKPGDKGPGQMSPEDQKKMAEMYMKAAQPGEEHKKLAEMAGDWDANVTMYEGPAPTKSAGKMHAEVIMGGRYLMMKFEGNMAMPGAGSMQFHGMGISGYDNGKKMYVNTWIDDMGTGILIAEGTASPDGKVITLRGQHVDPAGRQRNYRWVTTIESDDRYTFDWFDSDANGANEFRMLHNTYTRAK